MLQYLLTGSILLLCLRTDIRQQRIPQQLIWIYLLLAVLGGSIETVCEAEHLPESMYALAGGWVTGILPGSAALFLSFATREALGYGDALLILGCGISLGLSSCMTVVLWAFFFCSLWSAGLLLLHRAERSRTIPFVPFLLIGWVMLAVQSG